MGACGPPRRHMTLQSVNITLRSVHITLHELQRASATDSSINWRIGSQIPCITQIPRQKP